MKKLILVTISVILCLHLSLSAQSKDFQSLYDNYSKTEGYSSVSLGKKMLQAIAQKNGSDANLAKLVDGISSITIISSKLEDDSLVNDFHSYVTNPHFSKMGERSDNGESSEFYLAESGKSSSTFVMLSVTKTKTTIVRIVGYFNVKDISKLSEIVK
ncbi:MAG: DUF4252 domain-containing protein [Bacteroidales bacterium]